MMLDFSRLTVLSESLNEQREKGAGRLKPILRTEELVSRKGIVFIPLPTV